LHAQGLEILAGGFFANGIFSVSTGRGALHFRGGELVHEHVNVPHFDGASLLGGEAPLVFFTEIK